MSGQLPVTNIDSDSMNSSVNIGHPVQIIDIDKDHKFKLNEENLLSVLNNSKAKSKKVCVVSVAGAFRKGKSFLLDFFLRFLNRNGREDWMGCEDEPLTGFHWKGGSERDTIGILMWSEPFILKRSGTNEEIAILLMDTQGAFDSHSTVKDCATVFALSLMISSIHIYNIMQNLQEDDLQHLQLFTEYGKIAMEDSEKNPFQKLIFLLRDWSFPYEYGYGFEGGQKLLDRRFEVNEQQHEELKDLRVNLKKCFDTLSCYLLPHPGLKVCTNPNFDGKLKDIEKDFKTYVQAFVESTFTPKLTVKQINGREITTMELFEYFKAYCNVFATDELPEPMSILHATAEANNLAAKSIAKQFYTAAMEQHCGGDRPYMNPHHLKAANEQVRDEAIKKFNGVPKLGGASLSVVHFSDLIKEIDESYESYIRHNASKNMFALSRTVSSLVAVMVLTYVCSFILDFLWLGSLSFVWNFIFWTCFGLLSAWLYVKYSGEYIEVGEYIDGLTDMLWEKIYQPIYQKFVQHGIQAMLSYASIQNNPRSKK